MRIPRLAALPLLLVVYAFGADTALDRYVKKPDPTYRYDLVSSTPGEGYTTYVIDLTSQTWRQPSEVDRTVWKHWLTIVKPDGVTGRTGFLFITGGSTKDKAPAKAAPIVYRDRAHHSLRSCRTAGRAQRARAVSPTNRVPATEDGIIAYTWMKYMKTGDETWPLRLPMTKAAVRAMDTITSFMATPKAGALQVDRFVVSGGSKRGWTTWTTAAVDKRVVAIVPASIDLLNLEKSFEHHYRVYGFFAPPSRTMCEEGVMDQTGTPEYRKLLEIEEPYSYRDRLTMPKFMIQAAGDQFFLPDSSRFYFDDLHGEKYLRYVPNTDHSLKNTDARESTAGLLPGLSQRYAAPAIYLEVRARWRHPRRHQGQASRRQDSGRPPTPKIAISAWMTIGPTYRGAELRDQRRRSLRRTACPKPEKGWTAYFVELT